MSMRMVGLVSAIALGFGMMAHGAVAQVAAPPTPPIVLPQDVAFEGTMTVAVDATDLNQRIIKIQQTVPAKPGPLVLMLPKWLPGKHHPANGNIQRIAGLEITANGQSVKWTRDPVEMNAFHVDVPAGAGELKIAFQYLAPTASSTARIVLTNDMMNIQWEFASLYPAGYYAARIPVTASITLPDGWGYATALETATKTGNTVQFKTTDYETFVDSPLFSGRYFKTYDIGPAGSVPVRLNVMGDKPGQVEASEEIVAIHRKMMVQAYKLFGGHHYDHYDFLVSGTDWLGDIGLEHHQSTEIGMEPKWLTDWKNEYVGRDVLTHELVHSWNGKFRRPADMWTPNYQVPMRGSLLWVYEGQTQYWGHILAARSGLYSKDQELEYLAIMAAGLDNLPGREWRDLADTTNDPAMSARAAQTWRAWQRSEEYYTEGYLIWLDADTLIREKTNGKKSLDDFAKTFFGVNPGSRTPVTYTFDDIVAALNSVYAYDWATFLNTRLHSEGPGAPLDGITRGGYKLVYTDTPTAYYKATEALRKNVNLTYSLGIAVNSKDAVISSVQWDSPAFKAGMAPNATLIAVNGKAYDADILKAAITAAKAGADPIELLVKIDDNYRTFKIDYHDGLRYPKLERVEGKKPLLDDILAEKK
nr:peptidase M61 [Asticcacaulis sp. AC460]